LRRKEILVIFFRHSVELPAKNQPLLDYLWDIERGCKERRLCLLYVNRSLNWRSVILQLAYVHVH